MVDGGLRNQAETFNDRLIAGEDSDVVVGDAYLQRATSEGFPRGFLHASSGGGYFGSDGNTARSFGDALRGGAGDDTMAGDGLVLSGSVYCYAEAGFSGGDDNTLSAFSDRLIAGDGRDFLGGDVVAVDGSGSLTASGGSGPGGNGNLLHAFNDGLVGGTDADVVVGDVAQTGLGAASLVANAGIGATVFRGMIHGADGGDQNTVRAFDDTLTGGEGSDTLVGDVFAIDSSGLAFLNAAAGAPGPTSSDVDVYQGGNGGNDNRVIAFCDSIEGGPAGTALSATFIG